MILVNSTLYTDDQLYPLVLEKAKQGQQEATRINFPWPTKLQPYNLRARLTTAYWWSYTPCGWIWYTYHSTLLKALSDLEYWQQKVTEDRAKNSGLMSAIANSVRDGVVGYVVTWLLDHSIGGLVRAWRQ